MLLFLLNMMALIYFENYIEEMTCIALSYFLYIFSYVKSVKVALANCCFSFDKFELFNPLSANPTKWSNTLKQFFGNNR